MLKDVGTGIVFLARPRAVSFATSPITLWPLACLPACLPSGLVYECENHNNSSKRVRSYSAV